MATAMPGRALSEREIVDLWPRLVKYAEHRLGCPERARDATQDAYVTLYRQCPPYVTSSWLYQCVMQRCEDIRRHERSRRALSLDYVYRNVATGGDSMEFETTLGDLRSAPDDTEGEAVARVELARIVAVLTGDRHGSLVVLNALGYRDEDVAAALGWPVGTVKSRTSRARQRLAVVA